LGKSVLRLSVDAAPRFSVGLGADNHRSTSTGENRGTVLVGARNLTGFGEEIHGSFGFTDGAKDRSGSVSVPLAANGASVSVYYARTDAEIVERPFDVLDIDSLTETYGVGLALPVVNDLASRFAFNLGVESNKSTTSLLGQPFSFSAGAIDGVSKTAVG